jgi:hypothetical protein
VSFEPPEECRLQRAPLFGIEGLRTSRFGARLSALDAPA